MRKSLLIALILATASGGAFAQTSTLGNDTGTTTTSDDDSAPAPKRTTPATTAQPRKDPARSETQRSSNPRWHSFLPGMFR